MTGRYDLQFGPGACRAAEEKNGRASDRLAAPGATQLSSRVQDLRFHSSKPRMQYDDSSDLPTQGMS